MTTQESIHNVGKWQQGAERMGKINTFSKQRLHMQIPCKE